MRGVVHADTALTLRQIWLHTLLVVSICISVNQHPYILAVDHQVEIFCLLSLAAVAHIASVFKAGETWKPLYLALTTTFFMVPLFTFVGGTAYLVLSLKKELVRAHAEVVERTHNLKTSAEHATNALGWLRPHKVTPDKPTDDNDRGSSGGGDDIIPFVAESVSNTVVATMSTPAPPDSPPPHGARLRSRLHLTVLPPLMVRPDGGDSSNGGGEPGGGGDGNQGIIAVDATKEKLRQLKELCRQNKSISARSSSSSRGSLTTEQKYKLGDDDDAEVPGGTGSQQQQQQLLEDDASAETAAKSGKKLGV